MDNGYFNRFILKVQFNNVHLIIMNVENMNVFKTFEVRYMLYFYNKKIKFLKFHLVNLAMVPYDV